uniref:HDC16226 n=1 Tax=Drosophila melanogaster TaxID=7227 RepID=Q6IJ05_DROME|nr:TPA_inf: HDC16226 [Drosophila melanogaster]
MFHFHVGQSPDAVDPPITDHRSAGVSKPHQRAHRLALLWDLGSINRSVLCFVIFPVIVQLNHSIHCSVGNMKVGVGTYFGGPSGLGPSKVQLVWQGLMSMELLQQRTLKWDNGQV